MQIHLSVTVLELLLRYSVVGVLIDYEQLNKLCLISLLAQEKQMKNSIIRIALVCMQLESLSIG